MLKHLILAIISLLSLSLPLTGSRSLGSLQNNAEIHKRFKTQSEHIYLIKQKEGCASAIPLFRTAAEEARVAGALKYSFAFSNNLGGCQIATFQFQEALKTFADAEKVARTLGDGRLIGILESNISSLFHQMGNFPAAVNAAEEALKYRDGLLPVHLAQLLAQLATVKAQMGRLDQAEPLFKESIETALAAKNPEIDAAAWAWDSLAFARKREGLLPQAEFAAEQGLRMREMLPGSAIESSYMILGSIRADLGDLHSAIILLDQAERALHLPGSRTAPWHIYQERGRVKLLAGQLEPALADLRTALALARRWRIDVIGSDANRIGSEATLAALYGLLIEAGNRLYSQNHDPALIRETFEAAEENRAASLRAMVPGKNDWRDRLSADYLPLLAKLQEAEAAWIRTRKEIPPPAIQQLRSSLDLMEAEAGAPSQQFSSLALYTARHSLEAGSTLFSFYLGDAGSWVWALTGDRFAMRPLPARDAINQKIKDFEAAVRKNSAVANALGAELYSLLFAAIDPKLLVNKHWLLALDGKLFDLPFPALRTESGEPLIALHSLQITNGALMLQSAGREGHGSDGPFLGVGDPIYNGADTRLPRAAHPWPSFLLPARTGSEPSFSRLWGTGREIQASASAWSAPGNILLTGKFASKAQLWKAAENHPAVIHFATHILEQDKRLRTGWIALSIKPDGQPDYLTPEEISARSIEARLVVLSGCSSGRAEVRTASGLMGLTRAWIAGGAEAVLATRWPTPDDDGLFFEHFYRLLRNNPTAGPAESLRAASLEMANSGTWRANPSFWSGYFIVSNYQ